MLLRRKECDLLQTANRPENNEAKPVFWKLGAIPDDQHGFYRGELAIILHKALLAYIKDSVDR